MDTRGREASVEESPRDTLCGCVEFDSRSKYSIRDEISRLPSPCADDHNGLPALSRLRCTQLPLSRSSTSIFLSLALSSLSFTHTHTHTPYRDLRISSLLLESHIVEREESASSNEAKFITGVCRATIALIRLNSNRISRFRARPFHRRWKERRRGCNRSRGCCGNECRSRRREFGEWSGN